ncbi:MAG TPA: hypothetical protein VFM90_10255 [Cyclobacteriaceae bacterium]|nr:hypothetical protein [Cyclobacteriaceae bacterium]
MDEELRKFTDSSEENNQALNTIDRYLKSVRPEQPSADFTQQVMSNLHRASAATLGLPSRNNMLLLAGILVAIGVAILLIAGGAFDSITSITVDQNFIPNNRLREYIPSIPFNGKLIINIVILMNLALAFIILDRAVLKPWFERRRHA